MAKTDWPVKTLGGVATIATGKIDVNAATEDGAYPFFTCSRDAYRIDEAPFEGKAILVAGNGDLNVKYYEGRFNAYQRTYFLFARDETRCYPKYLFWFLENHLDVLRSGASGSTIKYIRLGDLSEASIPMPPLEEQKRIVALLDAATARVTELSACYELARTHAHNLFTSVLREELEGNPGWPVSVIGDVCELSLGKMLDSKQKTGLNPTPYLRNVNVRWGSFDTRDMASMDIRPEEMERVTASPGDVIVCEGGEPGRCAVWRGPGLVAIQKALHRVRPKTGIDGDYIALFLAFLAEVGELKYFFTGTTIKHIPKEKLHLVPIPVPLLEEQKRIVARLDSMRAKTSEMTAAYNSKLTAAKNLRQSILEAAFAGQL